MNAIELLKADHRTVEDLFDQLDRLGGATRGRRALVAKLVRELSIHSAIEEEVFYPAVKKIGDGEKEVVLESLEEHNVVKWLLDALESMSEGDPRFEAKLKVLRDCVTHHVEREEAEVFPRARQRLGIARLNVLGKALERAKKTAPTHPHPRSPDEPPANIAMNMGAAVVDRLRDAARAIRHREEAGPRRTAREGRPAKEGRATRAARATKRAGATKQARATRRAGAAKRRAGGKRAHAHAR